MFYDRVKIFVGGGKGGDGSTAFRREKYVPKGGPWGGDGGRGGSVILVADEGLHTLADFRYKRHYHAEKGGSGGKKNMQGHAGSDLIIRVPAGTVVRLAETKEVLGDLAAVGQQMIVARGGRGGRGNTRFATPVKKAPAFAEKGEPGEELWLELELKLLADVGLVGLPNAGKSTILSRLSAARPKVADYPFTTLSPCLGVVRVDDGSSFVLADIPGLIEGAHAGAGLGHEFLRHIERTRLIVHVVDASPVAATDPLLAVDVINRELSLYGHKLDLRPVIIVANKMDIPGTDENYLSMKETLSQKAEVIPVSGATGAGLEELKVLIAGRLETAPLPELDFGPQVKHEIKPRFIVVKEGAGFRVSGHEVEKHLAMTDLDNDEAVARLQRILKLMGVEGNLLAMGAKEGDQVYIGKSEFTFMV